MKITQKERMDLDASWTDFLVTIERKKVRRRTAMMITIAGLFACLLLAFFVLVPLRKTSASELVSETERDILLPDGTTVALSPGSRLYYPEVFKDDIREVRLEGEGYFEVRSSPERPFIVRLEGGSVKATGTKFHVTAYQDSDEVLVALDEGRVELSLEGHPSVVMSPSQEMRYTRTAGSSETYLVYKDCRLEDVMKAISAIYDVDYTFGREPLKEIRLSFRIPQYDDVSKLMTLIGITCRINASVLPDGNVMITE